MITSIPTSFNPSDYELLIKSVVEGNLLTKIESLKRLNTLVNTDKKQFSIYAKRIVIAIQQLLLEEKEDINLHASTLALQIINLNPKDIEYYIRTKFLKNIIKNLGDSKPQIRKTSHYCLLAYVKTYKTFDEIIQIYMNYGFNSQSWQLRQKSINSFQSILIMEMKYLNWSSLQFRKVMEQLLEKTKDQNPNVEKAAELCLLSIVKNDEIKNFSKKIPKNFYDNLKEFCEVMCSQGHLSEIKLYTPNSPAMPKNNSLHALGENRFSQNSKSMQNLQKLTTNYGTPSTPKQNLINRIQEIRKNAQTPIKEEEKKVHDLVKTSNINGKKGVRESDIALPSIKKSYISRKVETEEKNPLKTIQKVDIVAENKKIMDDLKNQKDWKVRLQAIEDLQNKFQTNQDRNELEVMAKIFLPIFIRLLGDPNFKVALISLKILEQILNYESLSYSSLIPQIAQKINDSKVALRQNIARLIRKEFLRTANKLWLTQLVLQLKKSPPPNSNVKEQILNLFSKITIEASDSTKKSSCIDAIEMSLQNIIEAICPLMDDLKTKIKIKTLDLLILLTIKTHKVEVIKALLAARLNQIYFQMYMEKIAKEIKNYGLFQENQRSLNTAGRKERGLSLNRRYNTNKNSGNSTSTSSLKKNISVDDHNTTARTASFIEKNQPTSINRDKNFDEISINSIGSKNIVLKTFKKKFDYKSTQNGFHNEPALLPLPQPEKQLKTIMSDIRSNQWQICSQALTKTRRILEYHEELVVLPVVRSLAPQIMRLVESLRSNLSKNAVITLNDLSQKVTKMLDSDLDSIFSKLLKKTLDTNSFISEEVRRALISICSNCNQNKILTLLINSHISKAIPLKLTILHILENITFLPKIFDKQLQRIIIILADYLNEGSLQIREKSKTLLSKIISNGKEHEVMKLISSQQLNKLKLNLLKSTKSETTTPSPVPQEDAKSETVQSSISLNLKKKKKQKVTIFPQEFDNFQDLLNESMENDWKIREKGMKNVFATIIEPYPKELSQHRLAGRLMDIVGKQISDPNSKVAVNALKIAQWMSIKNIDLIEANLSVLTNQIFNCFGSHKVEIRKLSQQLFYSISENIEKWMLIQHMCNGTLYGLQKSKPTILLKLAQILPSIYEKAAKKSLLIKNVYPMLNKLAQQNKPQTFEGLSLIFSLCNKYTEGQFQTYLKPKSIQLYNKLQNS